MVNLGEALDDAIRREILEEYGMKIEPTGILGVFDHFLPRGEHWVSVTYRGRHLHGDPEIREPEKCMAIGWFHLNEIPHHLSLITQKNLAELRREGAS
jgi:ADP-ribose pyrophosphatase YjhB (NUDIX family)